MKEQELNELMKDYFVKDAAISNETKFNAEKTASATRSSARAGQDSRSNLCMQAYRWHVMVLGLILLIVAVFSFEFYEAEILSQKINSSVAIDQLEKQVTTMNVVLLEVKQNAVAIQHLAEMTFAKMKALQNQEDQSMLFDDQPDTDTAYDNVENSPGVHCTVGQ